MGELKGIDYKILFELMKNSKMSDRQLAKKVGVSQPTVTRRRGRLEREVIDGYTIIPKWAVLGYNLLVITLVKSPIFESKEKYLAVVKEGMKWVKKQPNIIMSGACEGMGMNSIIISVHKDYGSYTKFIDKLRLDLGGLISDAQNIIVNLAAEHRLGKPFHIKYLTEAK